MNLRNVVIDPVPAVAVPTVQKTLVTDVEVIKTKTHLWTCYSRKYYGGLPQELFLRWYSTIGNA